MNYTDKELDEFDNIIKVAIANLYTLSKHTEEIKLMDFDMTNSSHLAIFEIARNTAGIFSFKLTIELGLIDRLVFKLKTKDKVAKYKSYIDDGINLKDFIEHIEQANERYGVFDEIYKEYYKR